MVNRYINDQTAQPFYGDTNKASYPGKQKLASGGDLGVSGKNKGKNIGMTGGSKGFEAGQQPAGKGYSPNNSMKGN